MRPGVLHIAAALLTLLASPVLAWLPDGDPVCTAPDVQNGLVGIPVRWPFITFTEHSLQMAWEDHRDASTNGVDLYTSGPVASGPGGNGTPVCTAPFDQIHPALVQIDVDCGLQAGCRTIVVAWQDGRGAVGDDIFAGLPYGTAWVADGVPVCRMPGHQADPAVAAAKLGSESLFRGVVVAWRDGRSGNDDIYAQKLDADGARLWDTTGVVVCDAAYNQWNVQAATGFDAQGALVTWVDQRDFPAPADLYVQSVDGSGAPASGWPAGGLRLGADRATGLYRLVDGGWIVWTEGEGIDRRLRATRVLADGQFAPAFGDSGVAVTPKVGELTLADAIPDGAGGLLVSWFDVVERSVTNTPSIALMVQRVDAGGVRAPGWDAGGTVITGFPPDLGGGALAAQSDHGAIVTWTGPDAGDGGVFAQRVNGGGDVHPWWPTGGIEICATAGVQSLPVTAPAEGGAYVAWLDERDGPAADVYAQYVTPSGAFGLAAVGPAKGGAVSLSAPSPNPTRGGVRLSLVLPEASRVTATVFDMSGRRVFDLETRVLEAGRHVLTWDGRSTAGREASPGVYRVHVSTRDGEAEARVVRLR